MSGKTLGWLVIGALIIVGGYFVLTQQRGQAPQQAQPTPTQVEEVTTEEGATPKEEVEEAAIDYTENGFDPQNLTVSAGTRVTWTNNSADSLQIASAPHPIHTNFPALNQAAIDAGESVSFVFEEPGTYKYHNHLNASQTGSVTVE